MSEPPVREECVGAVCVLTLDRPAKRNALDDATRAALQASVDRLRDDTAIRVVVLGGAGPSFSAGADLSEPVRREGGWSERRHRAGTWARLLDGWERLPQVTVARLHGAVVGGAVLLAAACDLRVGAEDTRLRIPELELGIPLTWGGVPRLAREVGLPAARDWVLTGREVPASEAFLRGFLQRVVPPSRLDAEISKVVAGLVAMPPGPMAVTKAMTAALGAAPLPAGWADADLLHWSLAEPESRQAAADYVARLQERPGDPP